MSRLLTELRKWWKEASNAIIEFSMEFKVNWSKKKKPKKTTHTKTTGT